MRIGIDHIATIGEGGNSVYTRELLNALDKIDPEDQYYLFSYVHDALRGRLRKHEKSNTHAQGVYISSLGLPIPASFIDRTNRLLVRRAVRTTRLNVLHYTNPLNFVHTDIPTVVTVHDLAVFHNNLWTKQDSGDRIKNLLKEVVSSSRELIAVSHYTKQDIVERLSVDPQNITVIPEAADKVFYPDVDAQMVEALVGAQRYFLYAGQLQQRKNILSLIIAFSFVARKDTQVKLVLVGQVRDEPYRIAIEETVRAHGVADRVVRLGYVENAILRKLYSGAQCFVYPSFLEGFGLPVIEALQCGTPVITSRTSSLPEVAGSAGLLVDPKSLEDIAYALEQMLNDSALHTRLKKAALPQAKMFSWEKAARETLEVYKKIAR